MPTLLDISGLEVEYRSAGRDPIHALNGVSLQLRAGEALGLLGESGSGKSTLGKVLPRLLPQSARVNAGQIGFAGRDLLLMPESELEQLRGAQIAVISQEPGLSLNPVMKVGDQVAEVLRAHRDWSGRRRRAEAEALLDLVGLGGAERRFYDVYPHQLSGGQQRRVVIAQALACTPALVIADEPTASLDPDTEQEILALLRELKRERGMALLLITHDPRILPGQAERVAVMYAGRVVEEGPLEAVFSEPRHPYTRGLLACVPQAIERYRAGEAELTLRRLPTINGTAPDPTVLVSGCSFAPRCSERMEMCVAHRPVTVKSAANGQGQVECFLYGQ
jgi:oligopeptide/dipeptide ABC transporter ATP-binding protein